MPIWMSVTAVDAVERRAARAPRRRRARASSSCASGAPKTRVEVGALVAERELEQVAAVARQDPLHAADEVVELARPRRRRRRSRCRRSAGTRDTPAAARPGTRRGPCAAARRRAGSSQGRTSSSGSGSSARRRGSCGDGHRSASATTPNVAPALVVDAPLADLDAVAERLRAPTARARPRPARRDCSAGGELVDEAARPARR